MAIYAISDLHLAFSIEKPMDIFGARWENYMEKIKTNWNDIVTDNDYVIIPGDISWATYLEQAYEDFKFIDGLPGRKLISKGNHDYWWTTMNKLEQFLNSNCFSTISFMHNNSFEIEGKVVCGTRGWKCPGDDDFSAEDRKIFSRELQRLDLSLKSASSGNSGEIIVALHYPPFNSKWEISEFVTVMKSYNVKVCLYGHIHGEACKHAAEGVIEEISFKFISSDYLNFKPLRIFP
ncbi:MAG: metallophosphoesterase [Clostridia bacterium]|nr:metallophosphoesterase [Clostridia bacterium]